LRFRTFQQQHAEARTGERAGRGAAVTIRSKKVPDGLAADEIISQHAVFDDVDGLRLHAFAVHSVIADDALALEVFHRGIIDERQEIWQHTRFVTGREGPVVRFGLPSCGLRPSTFCPMSEATMSSASVGGEEDWAAISSSTIGAWRSATTVSSMVFASVMSASREAALPAARPCRPGCGPGACRPQLARSRSIARSRWFFHCA